MFDFAMRSSTEGHVAACSRLYSSILSGAMPITMPMRCIESSGSRLVILRSAGDEGSQPFEGRDPRFTRDDRCASSVVQHRGDLRVGDVGLVVPVETGVDDLGELFALDRLYRRF